MAMLDEKGLRREGWKGDVAVTLADGQTWWLQKPRIRFSRRRTETGASVPRSRADFGDDYAAKLDALDDTYRTDGDVILAMLDLACALLQANYSLTDDQVDSLIEFGYSEDEAPENVDLRDTFMSVARGRVPKKDHSPSGGDPPS